MVGYKLSKNDWVTPFFVTFRSVREKLLVTVFFEHPISYYILIVYIILYIDCTSTISWVLGLNLDDSLMGGLCRALTDLTTQRLILDCWTLSTLWTDGGDLFWIPDLLQCLSDGSVGASAVNIRSCWRSSTTMLSSSWWKARETRPPGMIST